MNPRTTNEEIWRKLPGSCVEFSNFGGARKLSNKKPRCAVKNDQGYLVVCVSFNGRWINTRVHRAVLSVFDGPCPQGYQGSHLDGCKTNNSLSNLAWETTKQNHSRKNQHGTMARGERQGSSVLTEEEVRYIMLFGWIKPGALVRDMGIKRRTFYNVISGGNWKFLYDKVIGSPDTFNWDSVFEAGQACEKSKEK